MKQKTIFLITIFLAGILVIHLLTKNKESTRTKAIVGLEAPIFELNDIDGNKVSLANLKGKVVLLNFWATWCESCKVVNSSIQNLLNSRKDKEIIYVSILYKDNLSNAREYMKKNNFNFPVLIDDKNIALTYGIGGIPETFVINKKGIIKEKVAGPINWDSPMIKNALEQFLSE